jgi:hypothetical protein
MTPKHLRNISFGLVLALQVSLGACGSDDASGNGGSGGLTQSGGSGGLTAGAGGVATGGSAGAGLDAGTDAPVDHGPYPAGPYGNAVGDTIANLAWQGHVNLTGAASSDALPTGDYSTDDMRKSGKAYGLIHLSAFT